MSPSAELPLLLVRGGQSDVQDAESIVDMRRLLHQTKELTVAGSGHLIVCDNGDAFNEGVLAFIRRQMKTA
jgi:pimeloyl-ACP methyl ester carboxylesterase